MAPGRSAYPLSFRFTSPRPVPGLLDTIFLHAGLPKTGTSAIQEGLRSLSQAGLLARVAYPCPDPAAGAGNGTDESRCLPPDPP